MTSSHFFTPIPFRVIVAYGGPRINYLTQEWHVIPSMATTAKWTALVSKPISEILAASAVGVRSPPDDATYEIRAYFSSRLTCVQ